MPYTAAAAVAFAQRQSGRYGDGECWTLVEAAVTGAGGKSSIPQTPNFGPNVSYVWGAATTLAIVATDADLSKAQLKRMAVAAQDGMARSTSPAHTQVDGDLIFSVSTRSRPITDPVHDILQLGHAASVCLARAIARAIYLATPAPGDIVPTWQQKWGG